MKIFFNQISYKSKRRGINAYDKNGEIIDSMFPVFVNSQEFSDYQIKKYSEYRKLKNSFKRSEIMETAKLIKDEIHGYTGCAALYMLSKSLEGYTYVVMVSDGYETLIFPADENGITDNLELPGSEKGEISHEDLFKKLGYNIIK